MLGGLLALLAAVTFAVNNAAFRRGALNGTVLQAMAISLGLGLLLFLAVVAVTGQLYRVAAFPPRSILLLTMAGVLHFAWGRYCNFRATRAMGANLVGPVQQLSLIITLALAILVLGEAMTPLRMLGIALVVLGPALTFGTAPPAVANGRLDAVRFTPNYAEGYLFGLLSATGYGASPVMVRLSLEGTGLGGSLAGGLIAYTAAAAAMALVLLLPGRLREVTSVQPIVARWYTLSGVLVCLSQMFGYMALAVAPVSVVTPIQRLSLVFRVYVNTLLNRDYEAIGGRVWLGTIVALLGALALSVSTEFALGLLPLPEGLEAALRWQWTWP